MFLKDVQNPFLGDWDPVGKSVARSYLEIVTYLFAKIFVFAEEVSDGCLVQSVVDVEPLGHLAGGTAQQRLLLQEADTLLRLSVEPTHTHTDRSNYCQ